MAGNEDRADPFALPRTEAELKEEIEACNKKIDEMYKRRGEYQSELTQLIDRKIRFPKTYKDGYETGLTWKDEYVPGGPFIGAPRPDRSRPESVQRYEDAYRNNREFKIGFKAGLIVAGNPLSRNHSLDLLPDIPLNSVS